MPAQTVIKFRRDTAANWTSVNPVLAAGEAGLETDTGLLKYGNGTSTWTALSYPSNSNTTYLVRNNTGATIPKGTVVAATGAEPSGRIDVAPFEVTGLQDSELRVMGVATANIASGVNGTVMSFGTLTGLDTRGSTASALAVGDETWAAGDILYAHPTVPGKLTKVRPKHDFSIAFITVRNATAGQISIRIVPGNFHLEWMHDVELSSPSNGDVLQYNGTDWVNADVVSQVTSAIVDSAPSTLDTLNELAAALGDDANFASTVTTALGNKQDKVSGVSDTEIGYLDGVTSAIQTQLDAKASLTGAETLTNKTLTNFAILGQTREDIVTSGTGFAGYTFDVMNDSIQFITANATANGTLNFRGNSSTTLNTFMSNNHSVTCVLLITNGATPFRPTAFQIDGTSVTVRWQGGSAPAAGNANSIDAYTFSIIKTASATYTVLASQTRFA
jgi:hypothetical protein